MVTAITFGYISWSVLSLTASLVSAQFHVAHDDFFETIPNDKKHIHHTSWMVLAGLMKGRRSMHRDHQIQMTSDTAPPPPDDHCQQDTPIPTPEIEADNHQQMIDSEEFGEHGSNESPQSEPQLMGQGHRVKKMTQQMKEIQEQKINNIVAYSIK